MDVCGQIQTPAALPKWSHWCPLDRWLSGSQSRSGRGGEEKNSQPLPGTEPPVIQPVAYLLYWATPAPREYAGNGFM
jgi:hypothetical protein